MLASHPGSGEEPGCEAKKMQGRDANKYQVRMVIHIRVYKTPSPCTFYHSNQSLTMQLNLLNCESLRNEKHTFVLHTFITVFCDAFATLHVAYSSSWQYSKMRFLALACDFSGFCLYYIVCGNCNMFVVKFNPSCELSQIIVSMEIHRICGNLINMHIHM